MHVFWIRVWSADANETPLFLWKKINGIAKKMREIEKFFIPIGDFPQRLLLFGERDEGDGFFLFGCFKW